MTISINEKEQQIDYEFAQFVKNCNRFKTEEDVKLVERAYKFAKEAHAGSVRFSGEPYIRHSFEVAIIAVKEMGLGSKSATAALLHDVPTKTEYTLEDIERNFGKKVTALISGMITIKKSEYFENDAQASTLRQILLSISDDIRVVFVKLADRLHNIRTIGYVSDEKRHRSVNETLNIYSPLAHRLGLYEVKSEMEDLCLKSTNPTIYNKISDKLISSEQKRQEFIDNFALPIKQRLDDHNIKYRIKSRSKSIYSIWKKMQKQNVPFEKVYDLFAIRIIFTPANTEKENFEALYLSSLITDLYHQKTDRTRNWLEKSKDTGYRALHLTVMSNQGRWVEVQIRSEAMNEAAEYGLAAHWKYKGVNAKKSQLDLQIKEILAQLSENNDEAIEFLDKLKINLFNAEIFVFTEEGSVVTLPKGASALDFAFSTGKSTAFNAIACKVNGKTVSLTQILNTGDQVEIITSQNAEPKESWFECLVTHNAIQALKDKFIEIRKAEIESGKTIIDNIFSKLSSSQNLPNKYRRLTNAFGLAQKEILFLEVGKGKITNDKLIAAVRTNFLENLIKYWQIKTSEKLYFHNSINEDVGFTIAKCCRPEPGESIIASKNNTGDLIIHRSKCASALLSGISENDLSPASWAEYHAASYIRTINIEGEDGKGMATKISSVISEDLSVNMKSISFDAQDGKFSGQMRIFIQDNNQLQNIIDRLMLIKNVRKVREEG